MTNILALILKALIGGAIFLAAIIFASSHRSNERKPDERDGEG